MANILTYRLIADLLDELERGGYAISAGKLLQVQELLRRMPEDTPPERLRTLLAPLFATDPEGQRRFYEQFDKSLAQAREITTESEEPAFTGDETLEQQKQAAEQGERRWRVLLLALPPLLAGLAGFIWETEMLRGYANPGLWLGLIALAATIWASGRLLRKWPLRAMYFIAALALGVAGYWLKQALEPVNPLDIDKDTRRVARFSIAPGDSLSERLLLPTDTARLLEALPREIVKTPNGGRFELDSTGLATYVAGRDAPIGRTDTLVARLRFADRTDTVYWLADLIEKPPPPPPRDTSLLDSIPIPYPRDIAELQLDAAAAARFEWYDRYEWAIKTLAILLLGLLAWAIARWDQYRRAKVVAELQRPDRAPYVWNPETNTDVSEYIADAAQPLLNRLRGRAPDERLRLDMPGSIRATSRRAGRVLFVYGRRTLPPDFLLLIDRLGGNDHRARLFDALYQVFLKAEAPVSRYFYDGDPRLCFNEAHPDGIALGELLHRHAGAQLFIVGEGQGLLSPLTGKAAPWTSLLAGWPRRALLSPRPLQNWGARERQLQELLPLLPASPGGIGAALDLFAADDPVDTRDLLRQVRDALHAPFAFGEDLMEDLNRHFTPPVVDWIAACALWPTLSWDLTLHLGAALSNLNGHKLLDFEHLRELTRLPWFTEGRMPEGARARLLDHLAESGLEAPLREALRALLQQTPAPPQESSAYDDYRMNLILNELFLKPDPATRSRLEREFARYLAAGKQPDFVALRLLDRPATRLDVLVGDRLKKFAFREGLPGLGWRLAPKLLIIWAVLAAGIFAFRPDLNPCPGERVTYKNLELCLNNNRDRLLYLEYLAADAIEAQDTNRVDSLRQVADALVPKDTAFYLNTAARYYNYGVGVFNYFERRNNLKRQLPILAPVKVKDELEILACTNFQRGRLFYEALLGGVIPELERALDKSCGEKIIEPIVIQPPVVPVTEAGYMWCLDAGHGRLTTGRRSPLFEDGSRLYEYEQNRAIVSLVIKQLKQYGISYFEVMPEVDVGDALEKRVERVNKLTTSKTKLLVSVHGNFGIADNSDSWGRFTTDKGIETWFKNGSRDGQRLAQVFQKHLVTETGLRNRDLKSKPDSEFYILRKPDCVAILAECGFLNNKEEAALLRTDAMRQRIANGLVKAILEVEGKAVNPAITPAVADPSPDPRPPDPGASGLPAGFSPPVMVPVTGGTFTMGCRDEKRDGACEDDEKPAHEVTLSDFQIGKYEVTNEEYAAFLNAYGSQSARAGSYAGETLIEEHRWGLQKQGSTWAPATGYEKHPVINVTWYGATEYARWLSEKTGRSYRLPTEAEWEYAARGGQPGKRDEYLYSGSSEVADVAWYGSNSGNSTKPVGGLKANELDLFDMSGNVWEWCSDVYVAYTSGAQTNPRGPGTGSDRVFRGGSWGNYAQFCRVALRGNYSPGARDSDVGFRLSSSSL